ncbi:MAG TPA: hypothetical protein VM163_13800 [bacterium]|nr:hypothetical protein [bacterium]
MTQRKVSVRPQTRNLTTAQLNSTGTLSQCCRRCQVQYLLNLCINPESCDISTTWVTALGDGLYLFRQLIWDTSDQALLSALVQVCGQFMAIREAL